MDNLQMKVPEDSEQESASGKLFLRFAATLLCIIIGFTLMLMGYMFAITFELDLQVFLDYASICFLVCVIIWVLIGLLAPFDLFQRFFESLKGVTIERLIVFIVILGIATVLHWYLVTITAKILVAIFTE
ncbi:MAG: hypothetical protein JXA06_11455 [Bacteroidetes bacterium]|nr:hypothetical protein [Bacteroidota bacterium]